MPDKVALHQLFYFLSAFRILFKVLSEVQFTRDDILDFIRVELLDELVILPESCNGLFIKEISIIEAVLLSLKIHALVLSLIWKCCNTETMNLAIMKIPLASFAVFQSVHSHALFFSLKPLTLILAAILLCPRTKSSQLSVLKLALIAKAIA